MKALRTTLEDRKKQYRIIYELFWKKSRIPSKEISSAIGSYVVRKRMREAYEQEYIVGPDIRKRSYSNLREYMYFLDFSNPEIDFLKYRENTMITYHAKIIGFANMWMISKEKLDVEGDVVLEGPRSDYYTSYAPDRSWERALEIMRKKIENFNPKKYRQKNYIQTHFNESIDWDEKDELLYRYFKYDLRKPLAPVMRKGISGRKLYEFLERLPETCTIATSYYPESLSAYELYLFMVDTDYEDFIIELFSELPTTSSFFRIADKLFVHVYIPEKLTRNAELHLSKKLYLPLLMVDLLKAGIIRNKKYSIIEYSKGKSH